MNKHKLHQGDVQSISHELPLTAKVITKRPIALGEKSGHQHIVTGDYEMLEDTESNIYVKVGINGAILQHIHESQFIGYDTQELLNKADHGVIKLKPSTTYLFGIHKKFNPFAKVWEKVID